MVTLTAGAFRLLVWLLSLLSLRSQRALGRWVGGLAWHLNTRPARVTRTNLQLCFPSLSAHERGALAKASLQHTAQLLTESGMVFHWPEKRWKALVRHVEGEPLVRSALAAGAGVLLLVPHYGNWEFLALYLGSYGMTALYDPPRLRALEAPILASRLRSGARLVPIDAGGLKAFYESLRQRRVTALLPDQVPQRRAGVYVPFFGQSALTMTFAHRVIRKTQPRVFVCAAMRVPGGFDICFSEADPGIHHEDPHVSASAMNHSIEDLVGRDPAQYQWEYKRFKRQPPGRSNLYR